MFGAALLVCDSVGPGIASLEQLAVQRDSTSSQRAACGACILAEAQVKAVALRQTHIVVVNQCSSSMHRISALSSLLPLSAARSAKPTPD